MAITTYQDLIDSSLNSILAIVQNKNAYADDVNAVSRVGYTNTEYIPREDDRIKNTKTVTLLGGISPVDEEVIRAEFNNYLDVCGITAHADQIVTTKGLINFYSVLSTFIATKLVNVVSDFDPKEYIFYNKDNNNFLAPDANLMNPTETATLDGVEAMVADLNSTVNACSKIYKLHYDLAYASSSSCSSSSCSSSSSSSSCSSSSSVFIAYFRL